MMVILLFAYSLGGFCSFISSFELAISPGYNIGKFLLQGLLLGQ